MLCLLEPEIAVKRNAASSLGSISHHTPELAQAVVDTGAIAHLAQMILNPDAKLKVMVDEKAWLLELLVNLENHLNKRNTFLYPTYM